MARYRLKGSPIAPEILDLFLCVGGVYRIAEGRNLTRPQEVVQADPLGGLLWEAGYPVEVEGVRFTRRWGMEVDLRPLEMPPAVPAIAVSSERALALLDLPGGVFLDRIQVVEARGLGERMRDWVRRLRWRKGLRGG